MNSIELFYTKCLEILRNFLEKEIHKESRVYVE